jgi:N-acetylglucosamine kinase-like BadF-type ATPase
VPYKHLLAFAEILRPRGWVQREEARIDMSYFLGFDGGGTKTDCVLLDATGSVVGQGRGGPANPLRSGYDQTFSSLREAAAQAIVAAKICSDEVTHVCAGLAGAGRKSVIRQVMVFLAQAFPAALTQVATDSEIALEAGAGSGPGVVLIAGTGSVAYGRNAAGATARAGGYGPWIDDEGSAFEIGRQAVSAAARARDSDAPATMLTAMIPTVLNCPDWDDLILRIMKAPDEVFPKLFPVVAEAAEKSDAVAMEILADSAMRLGHLAATVVRRLGMNDQEFAMVKCGGVFGRSRTLDTQVDSALAGTAPRAKVSRLEISPALGAARMAARLSESSSHTASHGV